MSPPPDPSLAHLLGRMAAVEAAVRRLVAARRVTDPSPDDPFRGLYLSEEQVDRLLAGRVDGPAVNADAEAFLADLEAAADAATADGADIRLRRLARSFGLDPIDVDLLLIALAPDLDNRFEQLYGYLHDDVTRRRASIGLALTLAGVSPVSADARHRFMPGGTLVGSGLVVVDDPDRPFLTRSLQVADRVTAHLLGNDVADPSLVAVLGDASDAGAGDAQPLSRALEAGASLAYVRDRPAASGTPLAVAALALAGLDAVVVDLQRLGPADDVAALARVAGREARLRGAGLVCGPVESIEERGPVAIRAFAELPLPVVMVGRRTWDPLWSQRVPVLVDAEPATATEREALWRAATNGRAASDMDPVEATRHFHLTAAQVQRAAHAATLQAALKGSPITAVDLRLGARSQNASGLERLARRVEPTVGWDDLVLPPATLAGLKELAARARLRDRVIDEWGMRPGGGRGRGITGLFAGDSGTGKTMSAEVIAADLGLDMYSINLATVVDKYVGETEKNLERIFSEADGVNGVLLFDEADALFGKRSEVRDAHDRYANIEVAYLLQRMESFDGLALLSTNLRANLDDAFARRLDAVIDFPMPDPAYRRVLWAQCLARVPLADDVDLDFAAQRFELSGGNIRAIAVTAAYMAAASDQPATMLDLMRATQREYRKLGRLCVEAEFGPWYDLVVA